MKKITSLLMLWTIFIFNGCSNHQLPKNITKNQINDIYEQGENLYKQQKYKEAFKKWELLAENGHALAAYRIADMYDYGMGTKQDYNKAFDWHLYAAERGIAKAQKTVANRYWKGIGTTKNKDNFYKWLYICGKNKKADFKTKKDCNSSKNIYYSVFYEKKDFDKYIKNLEKEFNQWKEKPSL